MVSPILSPVRTDLETTARSFWKLNWAMLDPVVTIEDLNTMFHMPSTFCQRLIALSAASSRAPPRGMLYVFWTMPKGLLQTTFTPPHSQLLKAWACGASKNPVKRTAPAYVLFLFMIQSPVFRFEVRE